MGAQIFTQDLLALEESGTKENNKSPPNMAPYMVALVGLDQIAQVPELHPTYFQ